MMLTQLSAFRKPLCVNNKSLPIFASMFSGRLELTKLTYCTRLENDWYATGATYITSRLSLSSTWMPDYCVESRVGVSSVEHIYMGEKGPWKYICQKEIKLRINIYWNTWLEVRKQPWAKFSRWRNRLGIWMYISPFSESIWLLISLSKSGWLNGD